MNDNRTRIDDAIDRAVRDIMRRDPPAGFRGRVLSRLDEPARRSVPWPQFAMAAGALAVVVLAVVILRDAQPEPARGGPQVAGSQPGAAPARTEDASPRADASAPAVEQPARPAPRAESVRTATFGPRDGRIAAASLAPPRSAPAEALSAPVPMEEEPAPSMVPPIVISPLTPPGPIDLPPIVVPPLQIPAMQTVPASRPPR